MVRRPIDRWHVAICFGTKWENLSPGYAGRPEIAAIAAGFAEACGATDTPSNPEGKLIMASSRTEWDTVPSVLNIVAIGLFAAAATLMLAATQTWAYDLPRSAFLTAGLHAAIGAIAIEFVRFGMITFLVLKGQRRIPLVEVIGLAVCALLLLPIILGAGSALYRLAPCMAGASDVCTSSAGKVP